MSDSLQPVDCSLHRASLSMEFSRQEYWSGLPFLSPGVVPDPGIKSASCAFQADALLSESPGKPSVEPVLIYVPTQQYEIVPWFIVGIYFVFLFVFSLVFMVL